MILIFNISNLLVVFNTLLRFVNFLHFVSELVPGILELLSMCFVHLELVIIHVEHGLLKLDVGADHVFCHLRLVCIYHVHLHERL